MSFRPSELWQPALTIAAFAAGCSVASAAARLSAGGASSLGVWLIGGLACVLLAGSAWMTGRGRPSIEGSDAAPAPDALSHAVEEILRDEERAAPSVETTTEERADDDWRAVSRGGEGLRRRGVAGRDIVTEE